MQSDDFQQFLVKYKQNQTTPERKVLIKLRQCDLGASPKIAPAVTEIVLPIKHKKQKTSVKNSPRKPGSIYSKRMSRNTSGKFLSNEREMNVIPTQQLIRKIQADNMPM